MTTTPRQLAIVTTYDQLMDVFRRRVAELELTHEVVDHASGMQSGYASKLLAKIPIRQLGKISLGPMLGCLGLRLTVEEDLEALQRIELRLTKRDRKKQDAGLNVPATKKRRRPRFPKGPEFARIMRVRQILNQSPKQRSRIARLASKARWRKHREALRAPPDPT